MSFSNETLAYMLDMLLKYRSALGSFSATLEALARKTFMMTGA